MNRRTFSNSSLGRPPFVVELLSHHRIHQKSDVEALIAAFPSTPVFSAAFSSGSVAARLFFQHRGDALDAVVFFWSCRLDGGHNLSPYIRYVYPDRFLLSDLSDRLKALFAAHTLKLLEGEAVIRCRKKIDAISDEIEVLKKLLAARHQPLAVGAARVGKKQGLVAEMKQIERRLEEFRAAMRCILARMGGIEQEGEEFEAGVELFKFGDNLDWGRIQHLMARECRRLDDGLPIYAHRREILQNIFSQQVWFMCVWMYPKFYLVLILRTYVCMCVWMHHKLYLVFIFRTCVCVFGCTPNCIWISYLELVYVFGCIRN